MSTSPFLLCDGCGQPASPDHLARRLLRLEGSTRFRPLHIHTLLLSAFAPAQTSAFLYSGATDLRGEAALLLAALQIPWEGKPPESFLNEFQKRGLFLTHILECPAEPSVLSESAAQTLLEQHLPMAIARIRRSLKPKRVALLAPELLPFAGKLTESILGCPILLHLNKPFGIMEKEGSSGIAAFRLALEGV